MEKNIYFYQPFQQVLSGIFKLILSMRRFVLLFMVIAFAIGAKAQIATDKYWVQFTDKDNSPYSIDNPEVYLGQRALQRRADQGIPIDEYDIPVNPQYLEAVADAGATLINPSKWLNGVTIETTSQAVIEAINSLTFVEAVRNCQNDIEAQKVKQRYFAETEKHLESKGYLPSYYGEAYTQINQINGIPLHDSGYQGEGMIIAVLDGGFRGADVHPTFNNMREEGRLLGTRDFVYPGGSVYVDSGHGTSCLSTMAGYEPEVFVGTAPKASYYLLHTEDVNSENIIEEYNWVSGAEYADSLGVDVCSTSLGYTDFDMSQWNHPYEQLDGHSAPMSIGATIAASRGMICVNSAGNSGADAFPYISVPADVEEVMTIGAVDSDGSRAYFSSVGPTADGRIKPDVMAMGAGTAVASGEGGYYNGSGTSFSCPLLAGMLTCFKQANPQNTPAEIRDAIRECSSRAEQPDNYYGYGIPDFVQAMSILPTHEDPASTEKLVDVYPNPSRNNVNIRLKQGSLATVEVCDFMGRILYVCQFNGLNHTSLETFVNRLNSGLYFIKASSDSGSQIVKLVITK